MVLIPRISLAGSTVRKLVVAMFVVAITSFGPGIVANAVAQQSDSAFTPDVEAHLAFDAADTDGSGGVSEAELTRDAAAGFSGLDADRSGTLTPDELGPHNPTLFEGIDTDSDGALSFSEVMTNKVRGFEASDLDGDGYLSFEEMAAGVDAELEGQQ